MTPKNESARNRHGERGAALITSILIATLLLSVAGTVILTSTMAGTTAVEATAEIQAYYGAEAGLEAALDVLRGNVAPQAGMPAGVQMGLRSAVVLDRANLPADGSAISRLSGWLVYGNDGRVTPAGANFSYSITVSDPDDPTGAIRAAFANYIPDRLVIRSTGFGPRGAVKRMEMVVSKALFNFNPAAMLMMRGAEDGTKANMTIGDSNAKFYSGHDGAGIEGNLPTFGLTSGDDVAVADEAITKGATVEDVKTAQLDMGELPLWLQSTDGPTGARAFLDSMEATAKGMGRYFDSFSGQSGSTAAPVFTFVNGNANLDGGAGLLIVTGDLTLNGNPSFDGIILVLGNGRVLRDGGGTGEINGTIYVASFERTWPASENNDPHPFLAPTFLTNGAGNSDLRYNSTAVQNAINTMQTVVRDVREF